MRGRRGGGGEEWKDSEKGKAGRGYEVGLAPLHHPREHREGEDQQAHVPHHLLPGLPLVVRGVAPHGGAGGPPPRLGEGGKVEEKKRNLR